MKAYRIHVKEKGLKVSRCAANPGLAFVGVQGQHKGHFETSILDVFPPKEIDYKSSRLSSINTRKCNLYKLEIEN